MWVCCTDVIHIQHRDTSFTYFLHSVGVEQFNSLWKEMDIGAHFVNIFVHLTGRRTYKSFTVYSNSVLFLCFFYGLGSISTSGFQKLCGIQNKCYLLFKSIKSKENLLAILLMPTAFPAFTPATCMPLSRALAGSPCLFSNLFYTSFITCSVWKRREQPVYSSVCLPREGVVFHITFPL